MDVQAAPGRHCEHRGRQDEPVGRNDHGLGSQFPQCPEHCCVLEGLRLLNRQPEFQREPFDRRRQRLQAASGRPVGLRQDEGDVMPGFVQRLERPRGELRRAREDELHGSGRVRPPL